MYAKIWGNLMINFVVKCNHLLDAGELIVIVFLTSNTRADGVLLRTTNYIETPFHSTSELI